jgi:nitroreductase
VFTLVAKMQHSESFIPLEHKELSKEQSEAATSDFYKLCDSRRSVRTFSEKEVPQHIIETIIKTAGTAPSGAHKQPWHFCAVQSAEIKSKIRKAAEKEEYENYHGRMSDAWLEDLKKFGTNHIKPFLEIAPWLIIVFKEVYEQTEEGKSTNYYVNESVGIATGMLLNAITCAGLVSLTHTPSPMNFLADVLNRPKNERAYLLIPVGYPEKNTVVPDIKRKDLLEIMTVY